MDAIKKNDSGSPCAWTDAVTKTAGALDTWPNGEVVYCYANGFAETAFARYFDAATATWIDALGGKAGPGTGHGLKFSQHRVPEGKPKDCYIYDKGNSETVWNPVITSGTLVI